MALYEPKQRQGDLRWDYTCLNGAGRFPIGYCCGADIGAAYDAANAAKYHSDGHATALEACLCYRNYEVDRAKAIDLPHEQKRCAVCDAWTTKRVEVGREFAKRYVLCDQHQGREHVASLHIRKENE